MKILIVDDEKSICFALSELFNSEGDETETCESGEQALKLLKQDHFNIAIIDYQLPGINGLELLQKIRKQYNWIQVILITGFGSEEVAINAIKLGAYDYITKPFNNTELLNCVNHIRDRIMLLKDDSMDKYGYYYSNEMKIIIEKVKTIAFTDVPFLITGETGTGKELIAKMCHHYSKRKGRFIAINCSTLPESIIENELFGSEKGSYTGSDQRKIGLFELADKGTIFLDEIGEMPYFLQAKLLRVIQENEITRIGSGIPIKINSRIIAATNVNIEEQISQGKFREDLYYRLNVTHIRIPPLRERRDDIKPLCFVFLNEFVRKYKKNEIHITKEALNILFNNHWRGNIRELRNTIEKAVIFCNGSWIDENTFEFIENNRQQKITEDQNETVTDDLFPDNLIENLPPNLVESKKEISLIFEKKFINYYLEKNNWNVKKTSDEIGLYRQDLYKKINKYDLKK